jgi:acetate kinase
VHLAQADVDRLFGPGHRLTPEHELSQPGQFACAEKVDLVGPKGRIANVRVLGPTRKETQVEIAMTGNGQSAMPMSRILWSASTRPGFSRRNTRSMASQPIKPRSR